MDILTAGLRYVHLNGGLHAAGPDEPRPTASDFEPPTDADAEWWASENTGGCRPDDLSPEDRLITAAMTAMEWHLEAMALDAECQDLYEAGHVFC